MPKICYMCLEDLKNSNHVTVDAMKLVGLHPYNDSIDNCTPDTELCEFHRKKADVPGGDVERRFKQARMHAFSEEYVFTA